MDFNKKARENPITVCLIKEGKMTINKLTLAAVLTIGLMAGTMNSGIASNVDISNLDMSKLAACPLSGCQADVTPDTAVCPCAPAPDCGCNTGCAAPCDPCNTCAPVEPCDPCNPCEAVAPPCECQPVVQSVCASQIDGKSQAKQHYAYPANVYSDTQAVGSAANSVIIGEGSTCGCPIAPSQGVMVSDLPTCGCGCGEGITTGAAADMPVLGQNIDLNQIMTGGAAPVNPTAVTGGCPVEMQTSSGMEVIKRTIVPYNPPITGGASPITSASSFEDVPAGFWAGCDINLLAENKVVAGYPDRTFKPNLPVSRAEIASMAVNGFNLRSCGCPKKTFKDVPADHWANQAINTAVSNGLMDGYPGDLFKPNKPVTRAEAMVTLAKGIPCDMDNCKAEEILNKFCDGNKVPGWAKIPVAKAIESGALKDVPNGNEIQACKDASRADVASMLEAVRCAMGYSKKDVAYTAPDCGCTGGAAFVAKDEVVTIPTLCLKFEDEINAKHANIGDRFAAKTTEAVCINGQTFPEGSKVYGKVTEVDRPTGNCKGGLKLSFERIQCHDCKADLPQQVLTAQVKNDKKPNFFAKVVEAPFSWAGSIVGTVGRTVGGAIIAAGNAAEHVSDGVGLTFGETLQGQLPAAGRSLMDATKALVKAPIDLTRTALSGTIGLLQTTGDEVAYLVDPKGNRVTSVNPRENITVAFGCNSCTGCAAPVQPCDSCAKPAPCDCNPCDCGNDCGCK